MNPVTIPITLSPHFVKGKPRGYYLLAQRLFKNGNPHFVRKQYIGYIRDVGLLLTVGLPINIYAQSLFGITQYHPDFGGKKVFWLSECSLFPMHMGFRAYIPGSILMPSAGSKKIETTGTFRHDEILGTYYLTVPQITTEILLGKEELK